MYSLIWTDINIFLIDVIDHYLQSLSADRSGIRSIFVSSGSALRELSASDLKSGLNGNLTATGGSGGDLAFVIEPGSQLEKIDLSNAGLYGKNWKIGTFTFLSSSPDEALTGFTDSSIKGQSMNETRYKADPGYVFSDVYFEEYSTTDGDGHTEWYTRWNYEAVYEVDSSQQTNIDWKNWGLENLKNSKEAELIMYGNKINFRYFIGSRNLTMGQAVDRGILSEDMIHFEPRVTTQSGYRSNSTFDALSENKKQDILDDISEYCGTELDVETGKWNVYATSIISFPSSIQKLINQYFDAAVFKVEEDISDFVNGEWRNEEFCKISRNGGPETVDFKLRMGSKLWAGENDELDGGSTEFVVHNKYKGKADPAGWFSKDSTGRLSLTGIDNTGKNIVLSRITTKDGEGTQSISYDSNNRLMKGIQNGAYSEWADKVSIGNIRNSLITFRLYDQDTQSGGHNGTAVVFPFGW